MIGIEDLQDILGIPIVGIIPENSAYINYVNRGELLVQDKEPFSSWSAIGIIDLARAVLGERVNLFDYSIKKKKHLKSQSFYS